MGSEVPLLSASLKKSTELITEHSLPEGVRVASRSYRLTVFGGVGGGDDDADGCAVEQLTTTCATPTFVT